MAKLRSIIGLSGALGNLNFVESKAYGKYVRAKRGTFSPAPVNDSFKKSSALLMRANKYAKMIKDALDEHRKSPRDGKFWSRLVSIFRDALGKSDTINFQILKKFRISPLALNRSFLIERLKVTLEKDLLVDLTFPPPIFKRVTRVMNYRVSVIVLFVDSPNLHAITNVISKDYPATRDHTSISFTASFYAPVDADTAIVIVKCQAIRDNLLVLNEAAVGMAVVEVISLHPAFPK